MIPKTQVFPVVFTSLLSSLKDVDELMTLDEFSLDIENSAMLTPNVYFEHQCTVVNGKLLITIDVCKEYFVDNVVDRFVEIYISALSNLNNFSDNLSGHLIQYAPITDMQTAYLYGRQKFAQTGKESCTVYQAIHFPSCEIEELQWVINKLIAYHPALRSSFKGIGQDMVCSKPFEFKIEYINSSSDYAEDDEQLKNIKSELLATSIPLDKLPPFKMCLQKFNNGQAVLHTLFDMLWLDGKSIGLFLEEMISAYYGDISEIKKPKSDYYDYLRFVSDYILTPKAKCSKDYWLDKFERLPAGPVLVNEADIDYSSHAQAYFKVLNKNKVVEYAQSLNVEVSVVLICAYAFALFSEYPYPFTLVFVRWNRGVEFENVDDLLGDFTRLSWIPFDFSERLDFSSLVKKISGIVELDDVHQDVSGLYGLRKRIQQFPSNSSFPVVFTDLMPSTLSDHCPAKVIDRQSSTPGVHLDIVFSDTNKTFSGCLEAAGGFAEDKLQRIARIFEMTLDNIEPKPISFPSWLYEFNKTQMVFEGPKTLPEMFFAKSALVKNQVAISFAGRDITYSESAFHINQLAHLLQEKGIKQGDVVALLLNRSEWLPMFLLAILSVGAAYLPIDPSYPDEHVEFILNDSMPRYVIRSTGNYNSSYNTLVLDTLLEESKSFPVTPVDMRVNEDDIAYIIYTSGSTGKPKGCQVSHKAIANRILWMQSEYNLCPQDKVLQKTSYTFDVSVWEFFWPLCFGASLVMLEPDLHKDSYMLALKLKEYSITVCHFTPSMLAVFLNEPTVHDVRSLRLVFCSGEVLPIKTISLFYGKFSDAKLHNLYGPTEAAIDVSYWPCPKGSIREVPIGKPIANIQLYILNDAQEPVAIGEPGELYIGGVGLAKGYLNRPELTKERFIDNLLPNTPSKKLYRTGDMAKYLPDGNILYLGRIDAQVKFNGFRIELGEIEHVLHSFQEVENAVVQLQKNDAGDQYLVAFIKLSIGNVDNEVATSLLRKFILSKLPQHFCPNRFVYLKNMPQLSSGKIDRQALPNIFKNDVSQVKNEVVRG